ncbi:citryl-CoA lyase [Bradyrhizobium sp. CB82]|uniref:citryl-CoA lyase n=1 Tax=Bradyrhizobium sp. CB82 TaxID=3039159 RepID=UPI0024B10558|nr:citryl-CoA lyase [Bradyrhizobium sp. CB82]WFU39530.1 citryl-CoA lyase [Bradyrhizobium sp. CB82]
MPASSRWRSPGRIAYRGYPIEELIGRISFPAMIWLMLRGELPTPQQEKLLQAALVASVDHGPHAPSIAIAQMAVSCGLPLNGAMASAINTLDDVHGGAGEQAIELYDYVLRRSQEEEIDAAAAAAIDHFTATRSKYLPGFGHRFHPVDPRAAPLLALVDAAVADGSVEGHYAKAARAIERVMQRRKGRLIPMNIDGATAVIYGELGFAAPLARGIFCLSRAVGILSHAWEQAGRKDRNKGPMPKLFGYKYEGQQRRHLYVAP